MGHFGAGICFRFSHRRWCRLAIARLFHARAVFFGASSPGWLRRVVRAKCSGPELQGCRSECFEQLVTMRRELHRIILMFSICASKEHVDVSVSIWADNDESMAGYRDMERRVPGASRACRAWPAHLDWLLATQVEHGKWWLRCHLMVEEFWA